MPGSSESGAVPNSTVTDPPTFVLLPQALIAKASTRTPPRAPAKRSFLIGHRLLPLRASRSVVSIPACAGGVGSHDCGCTLFNSSSSRPTKALGPHDGASWYLPANARRQSPAPSPTPSGARAIGALVRRKGLAHGGPAIFEQGGVDVCGLRALRRSVACCALDLVSP